MRTKNCDWFVKSVCPARLQLKSHQVRGTIECPTWLANGGANTTSVIRRLHSCWRRACQCSAEPQSAWFGDLSRTQSWTVPFARETRRASMGRYWGAAGADEP